jgi:hypothetical protein
MTRHFRSTNFQSLNSSTISGDVTGIVSDPTGAILPSLKGDASPRLIQIKRSIIF